MIVGQGRAESVSQGLLIRRSEVRILPGVLLKTHHCSHLRHSECAGILAVPGCSGPIPATADPEIGQAWGMQKDARPWERVQSDAKTRTDPVPPPIPSADDNVSFPPRSTSMNMKAARMDDSPKRFIHACRYDTIHRCDLKLASPFDNLRTATPRRRGRCQLGSLHALELPTRSTSRKRLSRHPRRHCADRPNRTSPQHQPTFVPVAMQGIGYPIADDFANCRVVTYKRSRTLLLMRENRCDLQLNQARTTTPSRQRTHDSITRFSPHLATTGRTS
jgi:hypothetical protein